MLPYVCAVSEKMEFVLLCYCLDPASGDVVGLANEPFVIELIHKKRTQIFFDFLPINENELSKRYAMGKSAIIFVDDFCFSSKISIPNTYRLVVIIKWKIFQWQHQLEYIFKINENDFTKNSSINTKERESERKKKRRRNQTTQSQLKRKSETVMAIIHMSTFIAAIKSSMLFNARKYNLSNLI